MLLFFASHGLLLVGLGDKELTVLVITGQGWNLRVNSRIW